jgi:hypothetical protein
LAGEEGMTGAFPDPGELSGRQREFLCYGPRDSYDDAFTDESAVLAAWEQHRQTLLAGYAIGRRPWAWRAIDRPELPWRGYDRERSGLWRAGALGAAEKTTLERQWRKDFEAGRDLKWADVPRELIRKWRAERRHKKEEPEAESTAASSAQS